MSDSTLRTQELLAQEGLESIGQKLYNTINIELSGDPKSARRWIWELLQNAKDVIAKEGRIEINLQENSVEFSHNGSPFLHNHLLAILSQRSTKSPSYTDDEKQAFFDQLFSEQGINDADAKTFLNTSGRFGTGFMTTYLLSKKVFLEGIYSNDGITKSFNISLDRDASTDTVMKEKVKESFSSFTELEQTKDGEHSISDFQEGIKCDTKFIYHFDVEGKTVAELGIADLHKAIPFVLSFVEKLHFISVREYDRLTTYSRKAPKQIAGITIECIEKITDTETTTIEIAKLAEKHEALTIAIPVLDIGSDNYKILFPDTGTPRQFISFPLVGSETFPYPVIINSPLFNPDDSRSHIYLNLSNTASFDKKVNLNRTLFQRSLILFNQFLETTSKLKWGNLHFLAKSDLPGDIQGDWYRDFIQKEIRKSILETEIVITEDGTRIKPKDAKFPIYTISKLNEFSELSKYLFGDKIPRREDVEVWKIIIEANTNDWLGADFDLTLEKLLLLIQSSGSFSSFNDTYFKNESLAFDILNKIIQFTEDENKELLNRKEKPLAVFPNQTPDSTFTEKLKLSRDVKVPKELKNVLKTVGDNWYDKLVRDEITVFERDSKLTVKITSDRLKERIEKYFINKLPADERVLLDKGLFELAGIATKNNRSESEMLHGFLKQFFPGTPSDAIQEITEAEDFDWKPVQIWAVKTLLKKISALETMNGISIHLFKKSYPEIKEKYSDEENDLMFKVDTALNAIIQFVTSFDKNLLSEYPIIPNQLNDLCKVNNELFNDASIPKELKQIIKDFGKDCRGSLLHNGVSITLLAEPRNLKWICSQLDDIAIKEQENPELKQPIRELDKWISKSKGSITGMDELFKTFYRKRSGIVLNTYGLEERNQFDEILKSGMSADLAEIAGSGATAATVKEVATALKENPELDLTKVNEIASLLKGNPDLTSGKIEQLIELSKGWNPEMNYSPDEEQKRRNFENGWKGEAFVYKELINKRFEVEWRNKSDVDNGNAIIDFAGEKHFISERYDKYDLVAKHSNGRVFYIQVKSTTTDLSDADQIAMPISIREWNFVFETKETETFYLARVFNVSKAPSVYFMKLEKPQEL